MRARRLLWLFLLATLATFAAGQTSGFGAPGVTVLPIDPVIIQAGKSASLNMRFRISSGFHINSNKPTQEILIPTTVKLRPPADLLVGKIEYPAGEPMALPFMPEEKLSVYSGTIDVTGVLKTTTRFRPEPTASAASCATRHAATVSASRRTHRTSPSMSRWCAGPRIRSAGIPPRARISRDRPASAVKRRAPLTLNSASFAGRRAAAVELLRSAGRSRLPSR